MTEKTEVGCQSPSTLNRAPDARNPNFHSRVVKWQPSIKAGRTKSSPQVAVNARKKVSKPKAWSELWSLKVTRVVVM